MAVSAFAGIIASNFIVPISLFRMYAISFNQDNSVMQAYCIVLALAWFSNIGLLLLG